MKNNTTKPVIFYGIIGTAAVLGFTLFLHSTLRASPSSTDLTLNTDIDGSSDMPSALSDQEARKPADTALYEDVRAAVFPPEGFRSKIALGHSIVRLVEYGVINKDKVEALYENRGGLPTEMANVLEKPSSETILLTQENANVYVNLLWPLGLAQQLSTNERSPINGESLFNFASTAGWSLGNEENGGAYFNKFRIVELTPEEEALVTRIAEQTFRPCCNNSTFYQDCNHGSALLGLLILGASQGLSEEDLYREALAFNTFWFPHNYIQTALYFKAVENADWADVDPRTVMGEQFSTISGWNENVGKKVQALGLLPQTGGGAGCGV